MVPLNEVKGQMEGEIVSHFNMLVSSRLKQQTVKGKCNAQKFEISASSWMHRSGFNPWDLLKSFFFFLSQPVLS